MVRLVFRPYTHVRRTICTSVSLRTSSRVSPAFILRRHRSPSFGSQQIRSYSNLPQATRSVDSATARKGAVSYLRAVTPLHFHCASGFNTQILAYMLDSLVRVSRRVKENHFVRIANVKHLETSLGVARVDCSTALLSKQTNTPSRGAPSRKKRVRCRHSLSLDHDSTRWPIKQVARRRRATLPPAFSHGRN